MGENMLARRRTAEKTEAQQLEVMIEQISNSTGWTRDEIAHKLAASLTTPVRPLQESWHLVPRSELPFRIRVGLWLDDRLANLCLAAAELLAAWRSRGRLLGAPGIGDETGRYER